MSCRGNQPVCRQGVLIKMNEENNKTRWKTFTEEVEVAGHQLIDEISRLIKQGNVRRLRVRSKNDDVVFEVPLTASAVVGGVVVLAAPALAVLGALAGLLAKVKIEIVRTTDSEEDEPEEDKSNAA